MTPTDPADASARTSGSRGPRVFSRDEIEAIKARTPTPAGTPEERRARLQRALNTFASGKEFTPASRLLRRG